MIPSPKSLNGVLAAIGCFFGQLITEGFAITVQVLYPGLIEKFEISNFEVSIIGSLLTGFFFSMCPISQFIVTKTSHRTIVISSGILAAFGTLATMFATKYWHLVCLTVMFSVPLGAAFMPSLTAASLHFSGWRQHVVIASGCVGGGIGSLTFPAVFGWISKTEPFDLCFLATACILLQLVVCGALMFPVMTETPLIKSSSTRKSLVNSSLSKKHRDGTNAISRWFTGAVQRYQGVERFKLAALFFCNFLWNGASFAFLATMSLRLDNWGYFEPEIAYVFVLMGVTCAVGRVLACGLAMFKVRTLIYFAATALSGVSIVPLLMDTTYQTYCIVSSAYGLFLGIQCAILPSVCIHLFGRSNAERAIGIAYFACGAGAIIGPPIMGLLLDVGVSFFVLFAAESVIIVGAGMLVLPNMCIHNSD